MLPKEVMELTAGFIRVFDSEHPIQKEFRTAQKKVAESLVQRGMRWPSGGALLAVGKSMTGFLEGRIGYFWSKLREVIVATKIEIYPNLANDLKAEIAAQYNPTRQAAEQYLEGLRQGLGHCVENKIALDNLLLKINAEVDLFCVSLAATQKTQKQSGGPTFNNFTGIYGNVTNSQVTVHDYSSVHQLLIDHNVPMLQRHELEGIMEELKTAPPEKRTSLVQRSKDWVVKNKEFLGATGEIVAKALGND